MLIEKMAGENPVLKMLMNGGNPQEVVMQELQRQGINPDEFISTIKNIWNGR